MTSRPNYPAARSITQRGLPETEKRAFACYRKDKTMCMQQFYETVMRQQQWEEDGCPEPAPPRPLSPAEQEAGLEVLRQAFPTLNFD